MAKYGRFGAMIGTSSIAILTSERAKISDPRVRDLADRIIRSQTEEITEMTALIRALEARESAVSAEASE